MSYHGMENRMDCMTPSPVSKEGRRLMADEEKKRLDAAVIPDPVNHPSHYTQGGIECIEAIKASMTSEEFCGYLKGCALKYLWRYKHKGKPVEDLKKASWYQDRLIKEMEYASSLPICNVSQER